MLRRWKTCSHGGIEIYPPLSLNRYCLLGLSPKNAGRGWCIFWQWKSPVVNWPLAISDLACLTSASLATNLLSRLRKSEMLKPIFLSFAARLRCSPCTCCTKGLFLSRKTALPSVGNHCAFTSLPGKYFRKSFLLIPKLHTQQSCIFSS